MAKWKDNHEHEKRANLFLFLSNDSLIGHLVNFTPVGRIVLIVHRHDINNSFIGTEGQVGRGG